MRKQSAYYGEDGQYPIGGEIVRREGGFDYHADNSDPRCHHHDSQSGDGECHGHYNPKHPLQAAIDKYNNYKGSRSHVPIMNNTWIHKDDQDNFHIRHHNTDILSVAPNGDTTIDVDGYHTPTTSKRLHQFLPRNVAKMRNPSRAQGAPEHVVAVHPDPDHYVWGRGEERGKYGMHPDTVLHPYTDGISFNVHTGDRVSDYAATASNIVRPPMARGTHDPGPRARPSRNYYDTGTSYDHGGDYYGPDHPNHPAYVPPTPMHEQESTHEQIRRQLDDETQYSSPETYGDNVYMDFTHHDMPRDDESYDEWLDRTTKPAEKVACPSCKGRGTVRSKGPVPEGVQPWEHKESCPSCKGEGLVPNTHRISRLGNLVGRDVLIQRYAEGLRIMAALTIEAYGETKAPTQVDTLRDDACPVCGESDAFDGDQCQVCGFVTPPKMFQDPDLDKAKLLDLRSDPASGAPNDVDPNVGQNLPPVDPEAVDEEGGVPGDGDQDGDVVGEDATEIQDADNDGVVEGDVRTLDDAPVDPDQVDEDGEAPPVDTEAPGKKKPQGGEPFTKGPNAPTPEEPMDPATMEEEQEEEDAEEGVPDAADGQENVADEGEEEGAPGYAGDETPDLFCPACGFETVASQPMSTGMDANAPADVGDGMLEGDVCPQCQKATLMGVGQLNEMDAEAAAI